MKPAYAKPLALGLLRAALLSERASSQTALSPAKQDVPVPPEIYSSYVARTAVDKNFAKGLYWGDIHGQLLNEERVL